MPATLLVHYNDEYTRCDWWMLKGRGPAQARAVPYSLHQMEQPAQHNSILPVYSKHCSN